MSSATKDSVSIPHLHPDILRLSPSISSILTAYDKEGHGNVELLKAILDAKKHEDERLTALTNLHLETLRMENIRASALMLHAAQHQAYFIPPPPSPPALCSPPPMSNKRKRSTSSEEDEGRKVTSSRRR
ncbi:hypothetical protein BT69DRAFT_262225 [Atractiella rhizophila]|nr:hypothetical protein BT69DRAFT_262225 [Atractiella rhizophila]